MNKRQYSLFYCSLLIVHCSLLFLSSCEDLFQDKIPKSDKNDTLDGLFYRKVDEITKLGTPMQFYIAPYYSSSEIRLTWSSVRGAAYYMVERAVGTPGEEPDDGDFEPLEKFVYGTTYTDGILESPALDSPEFMNEYFYRVSAFNPKQKYDESDPSIPQSAMLFRAPGNVKATGGESEEHIMVTWDRTPGADSYEIWRSENPSGTSPTSLGIIYGNQTWYRNVVSLTEQGKDFYYMITAQNSFKNKTPQTKPAYGYSRVFGAPNAPENVRLAAGSGRGNSTTEIKIEWDPSDVAEAYYAVYRYSEVDSSLTRLIGKLEPPSGATTITYTDNQGLKTGIYYYYKIQAIVEDESTGKELKSSFSPDKKAESFLLTSPEEVIAEKNAIDGTVTVKWKPAMGNEGERLQYTYNVYAGNAVEGDLPGPVTSVPSSTGADGYISATGLSQSNTFFRVTTVNGILESSQSMAVSPSPAAAVIQDASRHAYIANEGANPNGVYPVKITWKKPTDDEERPAFYNIQRSTRSGGGFSKINDVSLGANGPWSSVYSYDSATGIYTYIDKNESARVARKYYYRVLSLNQLEQGSFPSDEKIGWGGLTHNQYLLEYNKTMSSALKKLTLMYKSVSTDKLGTETKYGSIGGSIYYNAAMDGVGARIIIRLTNYADFYIENDPANGVYFTLNGNSNTTANMSSNGSMDGTVTCTGMYPGSVSYDRIEIKGGGAGGGTYGVQPEGFSRQEVTYTLIN